MPKETTIPHRNLVLIFECFFACSSFFRFLRHFVAQNDQVYYGERDVTIYLLDPELNSDDIFCHRETL